MSESGSSSSAAASTAGATAAGTPASSSESSAPRSDAAAETASKPTPTKEAEKAEPTAEKKPTPEKAEAVDKKEKATDQKESQDTDKPAEEKQAKEEKKEVPPHRYADRLATAFPDRKYEKAEDYDTAMDEYLGNLEGYHKRGQEANKKLIHLFDSEPQVGDIVRDMIAGATFREAMARHISPDDLTAIEGDPDFEGWKKNAKERDEKAAKRKERQQMYSENLTVSQKEISAWAKENNLDEKSVDGLLTEIDTLLEDLNNGKITKKALTRMMKAFTYEKDIAAAREEAKIATRNEEIVAKKESPEKSGDGLPRPTKAASPPKQEVAEDYFTGLSRRIKEREIT